MFQNHEEFAACSLDGDRVPASTSFGVAPRNRAVSSAHERCRRRICGGAGTPPSSPAHDGRRAPRQKIEVEGCALEKRRWRPNEVLGFVPDREAEFIMPNGHRAPAPKGCTPCAADSRGAVRQPGRGRDVAGLREARASSEHEVLSYVSLRFFGGSSRSGSASPPAGDRPDRRAVGSASSGEFARGRRFHVEFRAGLS